MRVVCWFTIPARLRVCNPRIDIQAGTNVAVSELGPHLAFRALQAVRPRDYR
jgi:hypothetical protein